MVILQQNYMHLQSDIYSNQKLMTLFYQLMVEPQVIRYIKKLLRHPSVKTTKIYTHITDISKCRLKSPLNVL